MNDRGWQRRFDEPIALPGGGKLVVFRDALPEWQAAIEALILVVELGGPTMFARIGVMRALNRGLFASSTRQASSITGGEESSGGDQ